MTNSGTETVLNAAEPSVGEKKVLAEAAAQAEGAKKVLAEATA